MKHSLSSRNLLAAITAVLLWASVGEIKSAVAAPVNGGIAITATIQPNPPGVGDNTVDLVITDPATGSAVTEAKLGVSVAMTSMDMGTTRPKVRDMGNGHYRALVNFSMKGPWRVMVSGQAPGNRTISSALDIEAGSGKPWVQAPGTGSLPAGQPGRTGKSTMSHMDHAGMSGMDHGAMSGMDHGAMSGMNGMQMGSGSSMHEMTNRIPVLKEKGETTATGGEDWKVRTGFGKNEPMVGMMVHMMVEGGGMEHMRMAPMELNFGPENYIDDGNDTGMAGMDMSGMAKPGGETGHAAAGHSASGHGAGAVAAHQHPGQGSSQAMNEMPGMAPTHNAHDARDTHAGSDTHTGHDSNVPAPATALPGRAEPATTTPPAPPSTETPSGAAPVAAAEAGAIHEHHDAGPGSAASRPLKVMATTAGSPKVGNNKLNITVLDAKGMPLTGAKVSATVIMTSMDMGTTRPTAKEMGNGKYAANVSFSMAGPWRVTVKVVGPGQKQETKAFGFMVK